jgi:hypothetical protein
MGYVTHARGQITIDPPIPWGEIKDSPFTPSVFGYNDRDVRFVVAEESVDTPEGTLIRRHATGIVQSDEDEPRNEEIHEHLEELVRRHGAGRTFTGRFDMEGEETGDLWRLKIMPDGTVRRFDPVVQWPEESE